MSDIFSTFTVWDVALWLAGSSLILLVAGELLSPYVNKRNILIETRKIRTLAVLFAVAFIFTVGIKVVTITSQ